MAVRRESVRLDVEGNFAEKVLADAAAVDVLKHSLKDLSGTSVSTSRSQDGLGRSVDGVGKSTERTTRTTKSYSLEQAILDERTRRVSKALQDQAKASVDAEQGIQRVRSQTQGLKKDTQGLNLLWSAVGAGFPVVAPLGAVGAAGMAGIANDAGMAVVGVGSLVLAFHGLKDSLKALNKAALDPTAANLAAASKAMDELSPSARKFVTELQGMRPLLAQIQGSAQSGWFPGLTQALHNLIPLAPVIEKIFHDTGLMGGHLAAQGAKALAGPQWASFFRFVDTEAPKAMAALGHVVGSLTHGLAELWMAFSPLNNGFNNWLVGVAKGFDSWATGLSATQGFHDFIAYVDQNGPKVAAAMGAIANAVIQIVQAAAPLGGPTLQIITDLANVLATIANSPLGTPILLLIQMASVVRLASAAVAGLGGAFKMMGAQALVAGEEATAAAGAGKGGGLAAGFRGKAGVVGAGLAVGQIAAGSSGDASAQNNYGLAASQQNLAQMKAALADMERHLAERNSFNSGNVFSGIGSSIAHPLDFINSAGSDLFGEGRSGLATKIAAAKVAIAALQKQQSSATGSSMALTKALLSNGGAARSSANLLQDYNKATRQSATDLASAFDAETNYRSALKAAGKQAATNSAGINGNSAAALANRAALSQLRDAWNNQSAAVHSNLVKQAQARTAFIQTAEAMGVPIKRAKQLADQLLGIPKHINPLIAILAHDEPLQRTLRELQQLHDKTVNVWTRMYTVHVPGKGLNANSPNNSYSSLPHRADGGTVPKTGRPYADRHLYLLADGEEVISNRDGQADRHRALLKAINAGHRLAGGGTAGGPSQSSSSTMSPALRHVQHELISLRDRLKEASAAVAKEKKVRDALVAKMQQLSGSVTTGLRTDLFGTNNPWQSQYGGSSPAGVLSTLRGDIKNARTERGAIAQLKKKGIKGDALAEILAQGGLAAAQEFAALPASELAQYQRLFNLRQRLTNSVGKTAATVAYGVPLAADNKELKSLNATVRRLEAEIRHANKRAHEDRKHHTASQKKGASSAGRKNAAVNARRAS